MANLDVRPTDLAVVRLTLRSRDGKTTDLNISPRVSELGIAANVGTAPTPEFPSATYAERLKAKDTEGASKILAAFHKASAEFLAAGQTPVAERLAQAVVDFVVKTRPSGHVYTTDKNSKEGFIVSKDEINISGPHAMGDERVFRILAVGTWGTGI